MKKNKKPKPKKKSSIKKIKKKKNNNNNNLDKYFIRTDEPILKLIKCHKCNRYFGFSTKKTRCTYCKSENIEPVKSPNLDKKEHIDVEMKPNSNRIKVNLSSSDDDINFLNYNEERFSGLTNKRKYPFPIPIKVDEIDHVKKKYKKNVTVKMYNMIQKIGKAKESGKKQIRIKDKMFKNISGIIDEQGDENSNSISNIPFFDDEEL